VTVTGLGLNPTRTAFLDHLVALGCRVEVASRRVVSGEPRGDVTVTGAPLRAVGIAGPRTVALIDEIPIAAVLAAQAHGETRIRDASELRHKESDRLAAIADNLGRLGVPHVVHQDGLDIRGAAALQGAELRGFGDHRIAMAFSVAALFATGPSSLDDDACVGVSCPGFYDLLGAITA
jgi:3-phosphoshikimate 1-carboxyvinyltransferase